MEKTIKITGKGKLSIKPDCIRISMCLEETYRDYEETLYQSSKATEQIKDAFEELGFDRTAIKTSRFEIEVEYEHYRDHNDHLIKRFKGYSYIHQLTVEFSNDNNKLGEVLYMLAHMSLNPEISIEYTVKDTEKYKDLLLKNAIKDSMHKAKILTEAANVELGDIVSINYSWDDIYFTSHPINEMDCLSDQIGSVPQEKAYNLDMDVEDIKVSDTVTVIWRIQ